jgi:hypothetical protein
MTAGTVIYYFPFNNAYTLHDIPSVTQTDEQSSVRSGTVSKGHSVSTFFGLHSDLTCLPVMSHTGNSYRFVSFGMDRIDVAAAVGRIDVSVKDLFVADDFGHGSGLHFMYSPDWSETMRRFSFLSGSCAAPGTI